MAFKQDKPEDCPICCESMDSQKEALECGHWVHTECIVKSAKAQCPICRKSLISSKTDMAEIKRLHLKYGNERTEEEQRELVEGHRELVEVMSQMSQIREREILGIAPSQGNLDVVRWLIDRDGANSGHIDALRWISEMHFRTI